MPGVIYSLGYSQRGAPAQVGRLMQRERMLLLDTRYSPWSRWSPDWNRTTLQDRYGERYRWDKRLGNVNYQRHDYAIHLAEGHEQAVQEAARELCSGTSLILLCACADPRSCHRTLVAKLVQDAVSALLYPKAVQR